jgi:hypothetical protein
VPQSLRRILSLFKIAGTGQLFKRKADLLTADPPEPTMSAHPRLGGLAIMPAASAGGGRPNGFASPVFTGFAFSDCPKSSIKNALSQQAIAFSKITQFLLRLR